MIMDVIDSLILGIVQGLSEYLPISSSGHLEIFKQVLGMDLDPDKSLELSVMLHVATVLSTIVVLWREFKPLCTSFLTLKRDENTVYVWKILLSCIPVALVGFLLKDQVEELFAGNLKIVGVCLFVTALLLCFAYFSGKKFHEEHKPGRAISWRDALIIGLAQAVAVLPGLSRSGSTIATGIIIGDNREQVARFSFFMVIIPILGEGLLDLRKLLAPAAEAGAEAAAATDLWALAVGFLAAFLVGCAACKWMLEIVKKGKLVWFAAYCAVAGTICLVW